MEPIKKLLEIMAQLRDPQAGCPWDQQQDFSSIAPYTVEEAYEVADAIAREDLDGLREELGDLLFQVAFHARMAEEQGAFDFDAVATGICDKMIRRHPHVFGTAEEREKGPEKGSWHKIKAAERADNTVNSSALDGVALALPALKRAEKLGKRAAAAGFDWPVEEPVWQKVLEEIEELKNAHQKESKERVEEEFGDLLFSLVNISRFLDINPEDALRKTSEKFIKRFKGIEREFKLKGEEISEATLEELDAVWEKQKDDEKK